MVSAEEADENVCANCGIAGVDNNRLKILCDGGCDLVKYCSDKCREEHQEHHHEECKKRADELRIQECKRRNQECKRMTKKILHDRRLFTQPDVTHRGECPICFLPMPLDSDKSALNACCGQAICMGCIHASYLSNKHDTVKATTCLFCRTPTSDKEEYEKRTKERIEANDPAVLSFWGSEGYRAGDYDRALKYFTIAADFGDAEAHFKLGKMYMEGEGVEIDEEKAVYHWEKAAIGGHPYARHNLACYEEYNGNMEIAVKHLIIAANLGFDVSMKALLLSYKNGYITKEEYGATLRVHQAAIDATKSSQREVAERRQEGFSKRKIESENVKCP